LKDLKRVELLVACAAIAITVFSGSVAAQRDRVVTTASSQPTNQPSASTEVVRSSGSSRPVLTNELKVVGKDPAWEPLVKKTASVSAANVAGMAAAGRTAYVASTSVLLDEAIKSLYGIPYRYGSTGPYRYDCSGFVWAAFYRAGINFPRSSARTLWVQSEPVSGEDQYKFGTLVFLNGLGHMGIVADANGFYHASSSKGITYSPFKGYWGNRIVGFRRLRVHADLMAE